MTKGVDESVLLWFFHTERVENNRIAKMVHLIKFVKGLGYVMLG